MTSKTETAKQLITIAVDDDRSPYERLEAYIQADQLRKELKVGWEKLGETKELMMTLTTELTVMCDSGSRGLDAAKAKLNDFEMTAEELADQALRPQTPQEEHQSDFVPPTVVSEPPAATDQLSPPEAPVQLSAAERGAIGVMSRDLLQTDAPYEEIALAVRARYPHARTTARSLASVAADMRRDGIPCPPRRKGGK